MILAIYSSPPCDCPYSALANPSGITRHRSPTHDSCNRTHPVACERQMPLDTRRCFAPSPRTSRARVVTNRKGACARDPTSNIKHLTIREAAFSPRKFLNNLSRQCRRNPKSPIPIEQIDGMIRTIRGVRVMLDRDLAKIYGVPRFRFNEAIKRNRHRFPKDFMFQLSRAEFDSLTSQIAISKSGRGKDETRISKIQRSMERFFAQRHE